MIYRWLTMTLVLSGATLALGQDWITAPSYFTHDPTTGERVTQYAPIAPVYRAQNQSSVYHHTRSALQVGDSLDIYHRVDAFGGNVRPYGEWQFPFRPYSVPYPYWGTPYGGLGGFGGGFGGGVGGFGGVDPGFGAFGFQQPFFTGNHPDVRRRFPVASPADVFGGRAPVTNNLNFGPNNNGGVRLENGLRVPGNGNTINSPRIDID